VISVSANGATDGPTGGERTMAMYVNSAPSRVTCGMFFLEEPDKSGTHTPKCGRYHPFEKEGVYIHPARSSFFDVSPPDEFNAGRRRWRSN
jgi:hypothetical protein